MKATVMGINRLEICSIHVWPHFTQRPKNCDDTKRAVRDEVKVNEHETHLVKTFSAHRAGGIRHPIVLRVKTTSAHISFLTVLAGKTILAGYAIGLRISRKRAVVSIYTT